MDIRKILSEHKELQHIKDAHLNFLVQNATLVDFECGELILRERESAQSFFILLIGRARIEVFSQNHGTKVLQTLIPGDFIGFSCFIKPYKWQFDVRVSENAKVLSFAAGAIREQCERDYEFGYRMYHWALKVFAQRLQATRLQLLDVYSKEIEK